VRQDYTQFWDRHRHAAEVESRESGGSLAVKPYAYERGGVERGRQVAASQGAGWLSPDPWRDPQQERGCRYQLRLSPEGRAALLRRGEIRYADMFALLGGGESLSPAAPGYRRIKRLSTAFYTRVFERAGPSFRAAFSEHVSSVDEAAHNQAKWFAGYWGAMAAASAIPQKEVQGMLLKSVVPKHPEAIMHTPHALQWLEFMCEAADEAIPERESLLREAVLRFALHFLAFFDFAPKSLCEQRAVVDAWVSERQRNAKAAI
jgi:truncated hemoglobin YjbI